MEKEINVDVKMGEKEDLERMNATLRDTINQLGNHNRNLKHIIITGLICFTLIICTGVGGFFWYESQFDYEEESVTEMITEGDDANINNVEGDQYNDESSHNEEVK